MRRLVRERLRGLFMTSVFQQRVAASPDVLFQEVGGEAVLLDLKSESYFGLNEVGTRMWQLMKEETDLQGIFSRLVKEYEVDEGILFKDLRDLVDEMAAAGLIVLIPAAQDDGVG